MVTEPAQADLDGIYDHIADDSPEAAERFVKRLVADMTRLARIGVKGVARNQISHGLRMHPLGNFAFYFRVDDKHLIAIRIVRGSRDKEALEFD